MEEPRIIFRNKLEELTALAAGNDGVLTKAQVEECLGGMLDEAQMGLVFQYLEQSKIRVEGWSQSMEERLEGRRKLNLTDDEGAVKENAESESAESKSAKAGFAALFGEDDGPAGAEDGAAEEEVSESFSVLEQYMEEIQKLSETDQDGAPLLSLLTRAAAGDAEALESAAMHYLPMICDLAGEYEKDAVLPVEDLIQEGNIALWTALAELTEVTSLAAVEAQLMNAVGSHIEEVLKTEMDETDSDQAMARKVNRMHEAIKSLQEDAGRTVTIEELSAFLEMPVEEIEDILKLAGDELKMQ